MDIKAYAKINLALHVVGIRPDGFHDIETIFHRIALYDEIRIHRSDDISITCSHPAVPLDRKNLCWQAVELMRIETKTSAGASITITKNIPIGAGLGGGSSDAAAVLQHLPSLWNIRVSDVTLKKMAPQLGSDVPYFLDRFSAYAEGRGEILSYFPLRIPYWIVVVTPALHVSTAWAYKALSGSRTGMFPARPSIGKKPESEIVRTISSFTNDFEEVVFQQHPALMELMRWLKTQSNI